MLPKKRRPTLPGDIIRYEFLGPLGITQKQLAEALGITRVRVNEIILGKLVISLCFQPVAYKDVCLFQYFLN